MSASQDKVQSILQTVLEESLPLVHKGIFTSEQLQQAMCQREKLENNMLKPTFKLSDYLKAIQFQYSLQRTRRNRIQTLSSTNPLFKKQSKTDYIIIKRIIRLWDRTMHKFKYNADLWKQYLNFCIKANSKNQFYKALSNGLRFLPFCQDLWLIGVQYEVQIGLNLWKARKIFFKALKMNSNKQRLWLQMIKFEMNFLKTLYERQRAIQGTQTFGFITNQAQKNQQNIQQNQMIQQNQQVNKIERIKLQEHDDVIFMVYSQAITKLQDKHKYQFYQQTITTIDNFIKQQRTKQIINIIKKALNKIKQNFDKQTKVKIQKLQNNQICNNNYLKVTSISSIQQKQQYYEQYLTQNDNLQNVQLDKITCQFLTKPIQLTKIITHYLQINQHNCINYILTTKKIKPQNLPSQLLINILNALNSKIHNNKYLTNIKSITKNINTNKYIQNLSLLETVIKINKQIKNYKINNDIYRSINVLCKKQPEIIQRCLTWIHQQNEQD